MAFLITWGGLFLEFLGLMTVAVLMGWFVPEGQGPGWDALVVWLGQGGVGQTLLTLFLGLSYGLLVLLWEPFYLASGFALYLNSRTNQEGWDIELRFRELAARVGKTRMTMGESSETSQGSGTRGAGSSGVLSVLMWVAILLLSFSPQSQAQSSDPQGGDC